MAKTTASFSANDRINHSVYGLGTITHIDDHYTLIAFDENGARKFVTRMVVLAKSDTPAPPKPVRAKSTKKKAAAPKQPA